MDVTVIIPTYNRLWCLPKAVQSCLGTACKTEIIVVDDGSTDGTREWAKQQKGIVFIEQNPWGKCYAVNQGALLATGKYIRFLDSDDELVKGAIDEQYQLAEATLCDIVVSGYKSIDEQGNILHDQPWIECDDFLAQQLGECDSSHYSAYLFRNDFLKDVQHRPDFAFRDDRLFVLEAAIKYPKISIHKKPALLHRVHSTDRLQFTNGIRQTVQNYQHLQLYVKILQLLQSSDELTPRRKKAAVKVLWPLAHWIAKDSIAEAGQLVDWILELDPEFIIPERGTLGTLYKRLGFKNTEHLLRMRRFIRYGWK